MIEDVNLWNNPFLFIFVFGLLVGIALWLTNWFQLLFNRQVFTDVRKIAKEKHDADYSPLLKLHLMEVDK